MTILDTKSKDELGPKQGEIPLFCKGAIGLRPTRDIIRLHAIPEGPPYQKLLGLTFYLTAQGEGPVDGDINQILMATEFRVKLPGSIEPYYAKMSGWEFHHEISPGYYYYKPLKITLSGEEGDDVVFAILHQHSTDPYFPFWQFGSFYETHNNMSPLHRWTLYRLGLNVPVPDVMVPGWADQIPSEAELLDMLKPGLWKGLYEVEIDIASCYVENAFKKHNYVATMVHLGGAKYDAGQVSYVGGWYVGDKSKPWPPGIWQGCLLTILSGEAEGKTYIVVNNIVTDDNPPIGLPPNERLLEVLHQPGSIPFSDGVKPGDFYKIQSGFAYNIKQYVADKIYFDTGSHDAQTLKYAFEVEE